MSTSRKDVISRLRNSIKEVSSDSKYTNRYLWNVFWTNSKLLLKQESDRNRLYNQSDIWVSACVKMDKVSPILCDCISLPVDCIIYRSRFKLPPGVEGSFGLLNQFMSSPDLSQKVIIVSPFQFTLKDTKYGKEKYAFIYNGYLWTKAPWPYLIFRFIPDGEVPKEFKCEEDESTPVDCGTLLYTKVGLSSWLIQSAISMSLTELGYTKQTIPDELPNNNSNDKGINER